jgi:hypothetical protein
MMKGEWVLVCVVVTLLVMVISGPQASAAEEASLAGLQASEITVDRAPTPTIAEGNTGIAAKYPGDVGIEKDPDVVFVADFEGSVDEICSRWEDVRGKDIMSKSDEVPPGSGGKQSLLVTRPAGTTEGGHLYRRLKNDEGGYGYDQLFFRFYMKFNKEHAPIHHYGGCFWGLNPPTSYAQGGAGVRPKGDKRWITQVEPGNFSRWHNYTYWQNMGGSPPNGQTWGNTFEYGMDLPPVPKEKWICLEVMVKMNDIGDTNGELAYWVDGKLDRDSEGRVTSYQGKGFPSSGTWTYDKFEPYVTKEGIRFDYEKGQGVSIPGGKPFPGFAWRTVPELNANAIWLYRYMSQTETGTSKVWWDNVVIAKKYIGPLTPASE